MGVEPFDTGISDETPDSILSATRTSLGDTLRSVGYFTPSSFDLLYVRQDRYPSDGPAREPKAQLVRLEQVGFADQSVGPRLHTATTGRTSDPTTSPSGFTTTDSSSG